MPAGEGVRGINDLRFALLAGDVPGTNTDYVGVKSFSVEVTSDSDEQRGDDAVLMIVQENKALDINTTSAYANLAALGVLTNTTVVSSGSGPTLINTFSDPASANTSYVQITGQAKGRDATGSALRLAVLKAQLTGGPNWDLSEGAWMEPALVFRGVGRGSPSVLYTVASYATEVALLP
jgi:hypothetical protein